MIHFIQCSRPEVFKTQFASNLKDKLMLEVCQFRSAKAMAASSILKSRHGAQTEMAIGRWLELDDLQFVFTSVMHDLENMGKTFACQDKVHRFQFLLITAIFLVTGGQRTEFVAQLTTENLILPVGQSNFMFLPMLEKTQRRVGSSFLFPEILSRYLLIWITVGTYCLLRFLFFSFFFLPHFDIAMKQAIPIYLRYVNFLFVIFSAFLIINVVDICSSPFAYAARGAQGDVASAKRGSAV